MAIRYSYLIWIITIVIVIPSFVICKNKITIFIEWTIVSINLISIKFPVLLDIYTCILATTVFFISANVLNFAHLYIQDELLIKRLTFLLVLFIRSIAAIIFIPHIFALLLGWDGLGLVSFLLVAFYNSKKALGAGILTALRNRVGDAFLITAIVLISEWSAHYELISYNCTHFTIIILIFAAMTKSAQFPLSGWLPAAIEAPTPVSALVHSSTLVTAGVYLMIRFYPFLSQKEILNTSIFILGALTRLLAGIGAIVELDLKKVIALSTLSQLGFIIMALGLKAPILAFFHLVTHAMLKALLFICAGTVIHFHYHAQDVRIMGSSITRLPSVSRAIITSSLSLCALPFMSGLLSKDAILEIIFFRPTNNFIVLVAIISTILTSMYSRRLLLGALSRNLKGNPIRAFAETILVPLFSLRIGSIVLGGIIVNSISPLDLEPFNPATKYILSTILVVAFFIFPAFSLSRKKEKLSNSPIRINYPRRTIVYLVPITTQLILKSSKQVSSDLATTDQSWIEVGQQKSLKMETFVNSPSLIIVGAISVILILLLI